MSDLTQLLHGKLSPQQFAEKAAVEIKKDLGFLDAIPGVEDWILAGLGKLLTGAGLSGLLAGVIINTIKSLLTPAPAPVPTPAPTPPPPA